jgi:quercetin dioxygenase-like cupin family protein
MPTSMPGWRGVVLAVGAFAVLAGNLSAQDVADTPALKWTSVPSHLPSGAQVAVVSGDPTKPVLTTVELIMPSGYGIPPHYHPVDESIEVMEGAVLIGVGDDMAPEKAHRANPGDASTLNPGAHHFIIAAETARVRVTFMGPYTVTYVETGQAAGRSIFPSGF